MWLYCIFLIYCKKCFFKVCASIYSIIKVSVQFWLGNVDMYIYVSERFYVMSWRVFRNFLSVFSSFEMILRSQGSKVLNVLNELSVKWNVFSVMLIKTFQNVLVIVIKCFFWRLWQRKTQRFFITFFNKLCDLQKKRTDKQVGNFIY